MKRVEFDGLAFDDLYWWIEHDHDQAARIIRLIRDVQREPFSGLGKPEPLKYDFAGFWSRQIDKEHRLIYQVLSGTIRILACRHNY